MFALLLTHSDDGHQHQLFSRQFKTLIEAQDKRVQLEAFWRGAAKYKAIKLTPAICKKYRARKFATFPELA